MIKEHSLHVILPDFHATFVVKSELEYFEVLVCGNSFEIYDLFIIVIPTKFCVILHNLE